MRDQTSDPNQAGCPYFPNETLTRIGDYFARCTQRVVEASKNLRVAENLQDKAMAIVSKCLGGVAAMLKKILLVAMLVLMITPTASAFSSREDYFKQMSEASISLNVRMWALLVIKTDPYGEGMYRQGAGTATEMARVKEIELEVCRLMDFLSTALKQRQYDKTASDKQGRWALSRFVKRIYWSNTSYEETNYPLKYDISVSLEDAIYQMEVAQKEMALAKKYLSPIHPSIKNLTWLVD